MLKISPYTLCKMYHNKCFTREQIISKLVNYDYKNTQYSYDYLSPINLYDYGSFDDVVLAKENKLIDNDVFDIVYDHLYKKRNK